MNHSFPEEKRKIRKPHRCHACEDKIIPGPNVFMFHWAGVSEDGFWSLYMCEVCEAFYNKNRHNYLYDFSEGIYEGDFKGQFEYEQFKALY